jgi:hypothetical protein
MRIIIDSLDRAFTAVYTRSLELTEILDDDLLYRRPRELDRTFTPFTCGEYLLRSAASVEQAILGLTRTLWDDPFEWTLPEELSSVAAVCDYLTEVETERKAGFEFFSDDADLARTVRSPRELKAIHAVLLEALSRAEHFQGRAFAVFQALSDKKLPSV